MKPLSILQLTWLAAYWDGEGTFQISKHHVTHKDKRYEAFQVRASVASTDREVIDHIHNLLGVGAVVSYEPKNPAHKKAWTYIISSQNARELASKIAPRMIIDRKREAALEVANFPLKKILGRGPKNGSGHATDHEGHELQRQAYERVKELNHRGAVAA